MLKSKMMPYSFLPFEKVRKMRFHFQILSCQNQKELNRLHALKLGAQLQGFSMGNRYCLQQEDGSAVLGRRFCWV